MSKQEKQSERFVFVKDQEMSKSDFGSYEAAKEVADGIIPTPDVRVRVRYRNRTETWDVLVKRKKSVTEFVKGLPLKKGETLGEST